VGIYRKLGNADAAGEAARNVIEITSHKLEASLDDLVVLSRLAEAYARFGTARIEAYATLKRIFEDDPNDGLVFYNCACAYALLGEKDAALTSFRKAFDSGFRTVATWAKNDTAFDSVRNDPSFERLLAELR
jgi:adenylate cyclase